MAPTPNRLVAGVAVALGDYHDHQPSYASLLVAEDGSTDGSAAASFTVVLLAEPLSKVVLDFTARSGAVDIAPASVTFDDTNFARAVTVNVTAAPNDLDDGEEHFDTILFAVTSADSFEECDLATDRPRGPRSYTACHHAALYGNYSGIRPLNVTVVDDDTAGIVLVDLSTVVVGWASKKESLAAIHDGGWSSNDGPFTSKIGDRNPGGGSIDIGSGGNWTIGSDDDGDSDERQGGIGSRNITLGWNRTAVGHNDDKDESVVAMRELRLDATFDNYGDSLEVATMAVALSSQPPLGSTVAVTLSGNGPWTIVSPSALTFRADDWFKPVTVVVGASAPTESRPACGGGGKGSGKNGDGHNRSDDDVRYCAATTTDAPRIEILTIVAFANLSNASSVSPPLSYCPVDRNGLCRRAVNVSVNVVLDSAPPPRVSSLKFGDMLQLLYLSFDRPTDRAEQMGAFSCRAVLNLTEVDELRLFGTGSSCTFAHSSLMRITFGSRPAIVPGDAVTLNAGALQAGSTRIVSLYAEGSDALPVAKPTNPTMPTAVLAASSAKIGVCDGVTLDASTSSGSGGRSMNYSFSLKFEAGGLGGAGDEDFGDDAAAAISAARAALAATNERNEAFLELLEEDLPRAAIIDFTLSVANFLGYHDSATVTVTKLGLPAPAVRVMGTNPVTTATHSSVLTLKATVKLPEMSCVAAALSSMQMGFRWSEISGTMAAATDEAGGGNDTTTTTAMAAAWKVSMESNPRNPKVLTIAAGALAARARYEFEVFAFMEAMPGINNSGTVVVAVREQDFVAVVAGGGSRQVGRDVAFELDG